MGRRLEGIPLATGTALGKTLICAANFFAIAILMTEPGNAAALKIEQTDGNSITALSLKGEIVPGDSERLRAIKSRLKNPIIYLESEGGSVGEALDIGTMLHDAQAVTSVRNGKTCASACGLIWLSGVSRYVGTGSRVGFHASYQMRGRKAEQSGVWNALVGAYLTQLGYELDVIVYATSARPESMNWLNSKTAKRLAIDAFFGALPPVVKKWPPKPVPKPLGLGASSPKTTNGDGGMTDDAASIPTTLSPLMWYPALNGGDVSPLFEGPDKDGNMSPVRPIIPHNAVPALEYPVPMPGKTSLR